MSDLMEQYEKYKKDVIEQWLKECFIDMGYKDVFDYAKIKPFIIENEIELISQSVSLEDGKNVDLYVVKSKKLKYLNERLFDFKFKVVQK